MSIRVLVCGGGTGGHLAPALAIARELESLGCEVAFVLQGREIETRFVSAEHHRVFSLPIELPGERRLRRLRRLLRTPRVLLSARRAVRAFRPHVLLGAGGIASYFPLRSGWRLGLPCALLEVNARPGRASLALRGRARRIFCGFASTASELGPAAIASGIPVREGIGSLSRSEGRRRLGLPEEGRCLAVLGGSQGATGLNRIAGDLAAELLSRGHHIVHLCGELQYEQLRERADELGSREPGRWIVLAFHSSMEEVYAACDLVLARSGASTVAEIAAARRASILVPYPHHRDQHQLWNARELGEGAWIVAQDAWDRDASLRLIDLLHDERALETMGSCAAEQHRVGAASEIARELMALATSSGRPGGSPA